MTWRPQPGPQTALITADWCDVVLFGGAKYGGKTDSLLGDYLQSVQEHREHWHGIIVRQSLPELDEIIQRSHEIFTPLGASWGEQKKTWTFREGSTLKFRSLESDKDIPKYQGHCVELGTDVLLPNNKKKPIEKIQVGDFVETLAGPRRVTKVYPSKFVECVKTSCGQVHPIDHPILTACGWQSYASLRGIDSKEFEGTGQEAGKLLPANVLARRLTRPSEQGVLFQPDNDAKKNLKAFARLLLCQWRHLTARRPLVLKALDFWPLFLVFCETFYNATKRLRCGASYVQHDWRTALSFANGYQFYRCLHDEQLLDVLRSGQDDTPLLSDVAAPYRANYNLGAVDDIQAHNQQGLLLCEFVHPYSGQVFSTSADSVYEPLTITPIGKRHVKCIGVDEVSHYITAKSKLINKNSYGFIGIDEATKWATDKIFREFAIANNRWGRKHLHNKRIRLTANPGGPGHGWVFNTFIEPNLKGFHLFHDATSQKQMMFIPSKITDNQIGLEKDPNYATSLHGVGSPEMVRAWLEGDWTVITGAFFTEFGERHVIDPFTIPPHWLRFMSFDWGSSAPFSCGWWAVSDGSDVRFPPGALIRYREWYGAKKPNVGLKLTNEQIAKGILERDAGEDITYRKADPSIFKTEGGPSIAEQFSEHGVIFERGDNTRIAGAEQLRRRLIGGDRGPMIYTFSTCRDFVRTIPTLQHDNRNNEEVDTDGEDHVYDETRYALMSRPYNKKLEQAAVIKDIHSVTFNELINKYRPKNKKQYYDRI